MENKEKHMYNHSWFSQFLLLNLLIKAAEASSSRGECRIDATCSPSECTSQDLLTVEPDSNVTLICSVLGEEPVHSIIWEQNGRILKNLTRSSRLVLEDALSFNHSKDYYQNVYTCRCTGRETSITIKLNRKPTCNVTSSPVTFNQGETKKLSCTCSGRPIPRIVWYEVNQHQPIINNSREGLYLSEKILSSIKKTSTLQIYAARAEDRRYTCNATNRIGRFSERLQVQIGCPRTPVVKALSPPNVRAWKFSNTTLECWIQISDCQLSELELTWKRKKNGIKQKLDDSKKYKYRIQKEGKCNRTLALNILNVTEEDRGEYSCEITCFDDEPLKQATMDLEVYREIPEETTINTTSLVILTTETTTGPTGPQADWTLPVIIVSSVGVVILTLFLLVVVKKKFRVTKTNYNYVDGVVADSLFISYSSRDFGWVTNNLIPLLEKNSITYTIHSRDFELGRPIVQNMADSVYGSRKVLIVLSDNYLVSSFCRAELDMAMHRELGTRHSSLILVVVDKLKKRQLPGVLRNMNPLDYNKLEEKKQWEEKIIGKILNEKTVSSV